MGVAKQVVSEIQKITRWLLEVGLVDENNWVKAPETQGVMTIGFPRDEHISVCMDDQMTYSELYHRIRSERMYNFKMLDGAIVQMGYEFRDDSIVKHRLAFFSSPDQIQYQDDPELYGEEILFADVMAHSVVPFPLRFDYDERLQDRMDHPISHMTLGQFENCRIPVTAPLTPHKFIRFLLSSFYNKAFNSINRSFPVSDLDFADTIRDGEREFVHVCVGRVSATA